VAGWICWRFDLQRARAKVRQAQYAYEIMPSSIKALALTRAIRTTLLVMDQQPRRWR
jgi:hypothetical protein